MFYKDPLYLTPYTNSHIHNLGDEYPGIDTQVFSSGYQEFIEMPSHSSVRFSAPHTLRAGATVEGAHRVQALHHGSGGAAAVIGRTLVHILTAVTVALPAWDIKIETLEAIKTALHSFSLYIKA